MSLNTDVHSFAAGSGYMRSCFWPRLVLQVGSRAGVRAHDRIYAVSHVDVVPTDAAAGTKLVQQYVVESRKDKGACAWKPIFKSRVSITSLWSRSGRTTGARGTRSRRHTKKFREQIDPMLGSPYDERLHTIAE